MEENDIWVWLQNYKGKQNLIDFIFIIILNLFSDKVFISFSTLSLLFLSMDAKSTHFQNENIKEILKIYSLYVMYYIQKGVMGQSIKWTSICG